MEYRIFSGIQPRISTLGPWRFEPRPPLVANRNICVRKRNLCYYSTWDICVENYTWPFPRNDPEGMGAYTQPTWKKLNLPLNVSQNNHALECKANFIDNCFSLSYINALRMSHSFADVMSSLYMLLSRFLS